MKKKQNNGPVNWPAHSEWQRPLLQEEERYVEVQTWEKLLWFVVVVGLMVLALNKI